MSTKLNAEELAAKRYPAYNTGYCSDEEFGERMDDRHRREGYAAAVREVAQPIADERDALREALELALRKEPNESAGGFTKQWVLDARDIIAKYPKP